MDEKQLTPRDFDEMLAKRMSQIKNPFPRLAELEERQDKLEAAIRILRAFVPANMQEQIDQALA